MMLKFGRRVRGNSPPTLIEIRVHLGAFLDISIHNLNRSKLDVRGIFTLRLRRTASRNLCFAKNQSKFFDLSAPFFLLAIARDIYH